MLNFCRSLTEEVTYYWRILYTCDRNSFSRDLNAKIVS